ncbi:amidohydrolase/deacetylase family metallohydrolase [Paenibacillus cremeus]|uniref:Amidohydrolase/deacetylase family metallohydrolase n=1 Tax=Paenibacillus cremeus TaxID=2163881 RepID=A0A559JKA2_9BACL|nr:amidohydrolase/deacetylase family metallohydrolase [Paenibacillus cremeus]TVY00302.1 amidohydrolase/deacetylase family metallohydrolase [Paenibacillus cremeus]
MNEQIYLHVVDPVKRSLYPAVMKHTSAGFKLEPIERMDPLLDSKMFLSPGWIDLHAHVYDGVTSLSVPADSIGLQTGVHLVADAGSAGEATLPGFRDYVAPRFRTETRAWLNISSIGLVHLREVADLSLINVDRTVKTVMENRNFICGIKVRSSGAIIGEMGLQPLQLALLAAREVSLPVMVHIGEAPPIIDDVLDLLGEGDVVTHCYHGKIGHPWHQDGTPRKALQKALDRGVKLDVGHGAASFSFDIGQKAIAAGVHPYTISTDAHIRNVNGPVYDLPTTMTKLMDCGMPLTDVIAAVTASPAEVLRLENWCSLGDTVERATLFRLNDGTNGTRIYKDATGAIRKPEQTIAPTAFISKGILTYLESH